MYMSQTSPSQNTITTECCICLQNTRVYDTKDNWECESSHSGKVCSTCTEILKNNGSNCPICREPLTRRYNINNINNNIDNIDINIIYNYYTSMINNINDDDIEIFSNMIENITITSTDYSNSNIRPAASRAPPINL